MAGTPENRESILSEYEAAYFNLNTAVYNNNDKEVLKEREEVRKINERLKKMGIQKKEMVIAMLRGQLLAAIEDGSESDEIIFRARLQKLNKK